MHQQPQPGVRLLTVCGSLQQRSANRAAISVASSVAVAGGHRTPRQAMARASPSRACADQRAGHHRTADEVRRQGPAHRRSHHHGHLVVDRAAAGGAAMPTTGLVDVSDRLLGSLGIDTALLTPAVTRDFTKRPGGILKCRCVRVVAASSRSFGSGVRCGIRHANDTSGAPSADAGSLQAVLLVEGPESRSSEYALASGHGDHCAPRRSGR